MIIYYIIKHRRDSNRYISRKESGENISTLSIHKAKRFAYEEEASAFLYEFGLQYDYRPVKITLSEDIDINPTNEEYALWMGGARLEAYIAYKSRTALGVLDIINIFKVVFRCNELDVIKIIELIKSQKPS